MLVIIDNLDMEGISVPPHEAHSVLIIDSNAVLPRAGSVKQSISRRYSQILERDSRVQNGELYERSSLQISGKVPAPAGLPQPFRVLVAKAADHRRPIILLQILTRHDTTVKR